MYDYVYNLHVKDRAAARNLADWVDKDVGGVSVSFLSVVTEVDLSQKFMNSLFGDMGLNVRVQYLLFGSLLKGYDEFIDILAQEPTGKYKLCPEKHVAVYKICESLSLCGVSDNLFRIWINKINESFKSSNYRALSIREVPELKVDCRPICDYVRQNAKSNIDIFAKIVRLEEDMQGVKRDFEEMKKTVLDMRSEMTAGFGTILELLGNKRAKLGTGEETKTGENEDESEDKNNFDVFPDG